VRLFAMQTGALAAVVCAASLAAVPRALAGDGGLDGATIARIQVAGNRRVEADAVRAAIRSRSGDVLRADVVRDDVRAVWSLGLFDDVRADAVPQASGAVALRFELVERPSVRKVVVSGNREIELDDLQPAITIRRGGPIDRRALAATREAIGALYRSKGHILAEVDAVLAPVGDGEVDVAITIDEGSQTRVRRVSFLGNRLIGDDELRGVVAVGSRGLIDRLTGGGGPAPSREVVDQDVARLLAYYHDRGYLAAAVGPARVELSRDRRDAYVWIPVSEGAVHRIARIDRGGVPPSVRLAIAAGDVASASAIRAAVEAVRDHHLERGRAWAVVEPDVRIEGARLTLGFRVQPGPRVFVERIRIRGATKTRDRVIRRELAIAEGELYRKSAIEESRRRVAALGYFDQVTASTARGSAGEWISVDLEVTERNADSIAVSAGYSSSDAVMGQIRVSFRNLLGRGQSLDVAGLLSRDRHQLRLRFFEPHLFDSQWAGAFDLYNQSSAEGDGRRVATGGSLTLGRKLGRDLTWFATYKLEQVGFAARGLDPALALSGTDLRVADLFRGGLTSSLTGTLQYDTRNDRLFPTGGSLHSASVEVADPALGSENTFTRLHAGARHWIDLPGPLVLGLRGEVGLITSRDPRGVPLSERYQAGGLYDVRGFERGSLGPRIPLDAGDPTEPLGGLRIGGNLHVLAGAELEFPLVRHLGLSGVLFLDAGNAYNLEQRYCPGMATTAGSDVCTDTAADVLGGLRTSAGFGVRWMSPIGPLRFEWGIPLDRQPGERPVQFDFAIGGSF
jgi:outer membrane protein insertion porin family